MQFRCKLFCYMILMVVCITVLLPGNSRAVEYDFRGQLSGWTIQSRHDDAWGNSSGLRYIPRLILNQPINDELFFDTEVSLNGFLAANSEELREKTELELYRFKLRFATTQTETRIGLQKINFGPSMLLRSLRWFDRLDPRDPLQMTDGVYALRFRYNALNNANLWLWGLYGNDDTKGYEALPTLSEEPEFGGRLQYPVPNGEVAATFHTRRVDASTANGTDFTENRFALDGRWNVAIGLWFESVLQQQKNNVLAREWTKMTTLGMDYTFGVGNGLHVLGEHMTAGLSDNPLSWDEDRQYSALNMNYPLGYLDTLMAVGYYSWEQGQYYQYLGWQRTYDNMILNLSLFIYPQDSNEQSGPGQATMVSGNGGQIMIIFNH
ncbi:MAG: hypothetical protein HOC71_15800 [Candidatus Latescibacteria bacterium]|nr:hypothetical protein [Candidatus Latescibacterota bacterium]